MIKFHKTVTAVIYLSAAAVLTGLMLSRNQATGTKSAAILSWLIFCAVPLLFAFAYPVHVFSGSNSERRRKYAALTHSLGLLIATALFPVLALPFWENPMRDNDSVALALGPLAILCVFLVAALFLLIRKKSSLAMLASVLIWPYWLVFALSEVGRYFQASTTVAILYFLCFIAPVLLAFAAGAVYYRSALAHTVALFAAVSAAPWLYLNVMKGSELANVWIVFNIGDNKLNTDKPYAVLAILSVGLTMFVVSTSILRLLPPTWPFRRSPIRERTWPAVATGLMVVTIWFTQSVMPYRIPGAVDRSGWLMLQILHVEKRGLQFHENCVSVSGWRGQPREIIFAENNRRLFQYRFQDIRTGGRLSTPLTDRIRQVVQSASQAKRKSDIVTPIRAWNADRWYLNIPGSGEEVNVNDQAPTGIPELFNDLQKLPRDSKTVSEIRDVCLGFCYDPLSEMGFVYANDRCFDDGRWTMCH